MFVGIIPALDPSNGGMYQYSEAMLSGLVGADLRAIKFLLLPRSAESDAPLSLGTGWEVAPLYPPSLARKAQKMLSRSFSSSGLARARDLRRKVQKFPQADRPIRRRPEVMSWLSSKGIELLMFPAPDPLAFEAGIPSIMAVHDLQHRLQPHFPEVSVAGEWENREYIYRNAAREALLLLVDSEVGKEDLLRFYADYGATEDRIEILPFVPPPGLRVRLSQEDAKAIVQRVGLPDRFFLYPAQFWPHKNHIRVVEALASLHRLDVHIALCGSNTGSVRKATFNKVMDRAAELGVRERVHYLGYVDDVTLSTLYQRAVALVFPTFFGPTNIPVIEAWNFGLPVITSRIRGIIEQVGDAGLLVDPKSVEEIAAGIERVWSDAGLRDRLRLAGKGKLALYTPQDHQRRLVEIMTKAVELLPSATG